MLNINLYSSILLLKLPKPISAHFYFIINFRNFKYKLVYESQKLSNYNNDPDNNDPRERRINYFESTYWGLLKAVARKK